MKRLVMLLSLFASFMPAFPQWNKTSCPDEYSIDGLAVKGDSVYIATNNTSLTTMNNLWFSKDGGVTWTDIAADFPFATKFGPILVTGSRIFIGTGEGMYISNDNGKTFILCSNGYIGGAISCFLLDGDVLYAGVNFDYYNHGGIFKSTDYGLNWTNIMVDKPSMVGSIYSIAVKERMILAGTDQGVYKSTDDGLTWVSKYSGFHDWHAMALGILGSRIFCGTQAGMYRSEDDGENWNIDRNGLTGDEWFSVIKIIAGQVFAGADYGGGVHLLRSYSDIWTDISDGIDSPQVLNLANNDMYIFAGTRALPSWFTGGVFRQNLSGLIGIEEIKTENEHIHIYPNPVKTVLNISFDKSVSSCSFSLYTSLGQCVFENTIAESSFKKDVSNFPSGAYYGLFCTDEKNTIVKILKR